MGSSYDGATQHALAIGNAPFVKAMVPRNAMSDFGRYGVRHNGAFELRWFNWVLTMGNAIPGTAYAPAAAARAASDPAAAAALVDLGTHVRDYVQSLPLRPGTTPLKFAPDYEAWLIEAMSHGDYDAFWKDHGSSVVDHLAEYKDVPEYHTTGWYDSWGTSVANLNFVELRKAKKSLQRLIVGPWIHSSENLSYAGEAQFTADAALDLEAFHLRWFDHWLKGIDNGVDREPPVRIYVMGGGDAHKTPEGRLFVGGHWRDEQEWPLARAAATPYYLHAERCAVARTSRPMVRPPRTCSIREHPVPTLGGNVSSQGTLMFQGAADQRCRTGFLAVLRYQTALGAQRCAGLSDAAAGRRHRSYRQADRQAVGRVKRARYGFHRQADRRLPAQQGFSGRRGSQHRRQHRARAIPQEPGEGGISQAGAARRVHHRNVSDFAGLPARPPHTRRYLEQQLSAVRREPEHG